MLLYISVDHYEKKLLQATKLIGVRDLSVGAIKLTWGRLQLRVMALYICYDRLELSLSVALVQLRIPST